VRFLGSYAEDPARPLRPAGPPARDRLAAYEAMRGRVQG
jgi:hypothetical protein